MTQPSFCLGCEADDGSKPAGCINGNSVQQCVKLDQTLDRHKSKGKAIVGAMASTFAGAETRARARETMLIDFSK